MVHKLIKLQEDLINLIELDRNNNPMHSGKAFEPSINIMLDNEFKWGAEIYIYSVELQPQGGRRYYYEGKTLGEIISKVYVDIERVKAEISKGL